MGKPLVLAGAGVAVGVVVAVGVFFFLAGGGEPVGESEAAVESTRVEMGSKLGPHITLRDRIFNLVSSPEDPHYLKVETLIEFETFDERWALVRDGCVSDKSPIRETLYVGAFAGLGLSPRLAAVEAETEGGASPCAVEEDTLLHELESEIGTGILLIDDALTNIVTAKSPSELSTMAGKEGLRAEIREAVEGIFPELTVARVLFTNFIMQ